MLAAQWIKIFKEQAFVGRCGDAGADFGSMIIAARQVKNLMRLCFLMERKYAPYSKWFGTAFAGLDCAKELNPIFKEVLQARYRPVPRHQTTHSAGARIRLIFILSLSLRLRHNAPG